MPEQRKAEVVKRIVDHEAASGDPAEARRYVEKGLDAELNIEYETPLARDLHAQVQRERAETEARRQAVAEREAAARAAEAKKKAEAHPDLLGELLDALIDNALKYSEPGTPVTVRVGRAPDGAWVEVEDRGCGIEAADLSHLFRPFFRSEAVRRRGVPGVGLGLAVAHRIATALGGSIAAESEPGRGSRFRVRLPAAPAGGGEPGGAADESGSEVPVSGGGVR